MNAPPRQNIVPRRAKKSSKLELELIVDPSQIHPFDVRTVGKNCLLLGLVTANVSALMVHGELHNVAVNLSVSFQGIDARIFLVFESVHNSSPKI